MTPDRSSALLLLLHELHLPLDAALVRHEYAPRLDRLIPAQTPLAPVELALERETCALVPPRVLPSPFVLAVEHNLDRRVADGEVPDHSEVVSFAAKVPFHP